jgi:hypothetical protein
MLGMDLNALLAPFDDWEKLSKAILPLSETHEALRALEEKRQTVAMSLHMNRIAARDAVEMQELGLNSDGSVSYPDNPDPNSDGQFVVSTVQCFQEGKPVFVVSRINPGDSPEFDKAHREFIDAQEMARMFVVDLANEATTSSGANPGGKETRR